MDFVVTGTPPLHQQRLALGLEEVDHFIKDFPEAQPSWDKVHQLVIKLYYYECNHGRLDPDLIDKVIGAMREAKKHVPVGVDPWDKINTLEGSMEHRKTHGGDEWKKKRRSSSSSSAPSGPRTQPSAPRYQTTS